MSHGRQLQHGRHQLADDAGEQERGPDPERGVVVEPGTEPGLHLRGAGPAERADGQGRPGQPRRHVVVLLEQVGQVDLGREERRRDGAAQRDHRRQPAAYDEGAGRQQRAYGEHHDHQRDRRPPRSRARRRPVRPGRARPRHRPRRRSARAGRRVATEDGSGLSAMPRSAGSSIAGRRDRQRDDAEEDPAPAERLQRPRRRRSARPSTGSPRRPRRRRRSAGGRSGRRSARPRRRARRSSPRRRAPAGTARPRTARSPAPARRAAARPRRPPPRRAAAPAARSGPTRARRRPSPRRWPRGSRRTPRRTMPGRRRSALTEGMIVVTASASKAPRKTRLTMPMVAQRYVGASRGVVTGTVSGRSVRVTPSR